MLAAVQIAQQLVPANALFLRDSLQVRDAPGFRYGGAVYCSGSAAFADCRFEANTAVDGGAIMVSFSDFDLNFCTFLDNDGQFFGGEGYGPGGDFYWLTRTYSWSRFPRTWPRASPVPWKKPTAMG